MKTYFHILTVLSLIILSSCTNDYSSDKMGSPSGKYYIITTVNRTDKSKDNYTDVVISLYTVEGKLLTNLNTKAADSNKWAIGWDSKEDIIILNSSDIGTYSWRIENGEFIEIELTESIREQAEEILNTKYKSQNK